LDAPVQVLDNLQDNQSAAANPHSILIRGEHRLFCHITENWRGTPLTSRLAVVEFIASTTTKTGLTVRCELDTRTYPKRDQSE